MLVGVIGNTTDFDSVILGSSPKPVTNKNYQYDNRNNNNSIIYRNIHFRCNRYF